MDTKIQDNTSNGRGCFLLGLLTGGAVGAGLAIYFSPRLAHELRQRVTAASAGLRHAASDGLQSAATHAADVVDRAAAVADDITRKGQAARDGVADAVARGAHEMGRGAREVEHFARASKSERGAARS